MWIKTTKVTESVKRDGLYSTWINKGCDERTGLSCRKDLWKGEIDHKIFLRSVQFKVELSSGELQTKKNL